jgi:serine protease Do
MDLAILKATGGPFPHAELGTSADLIIGEWVVAIGNPFGTLIQDPVPSVSVGVVSAVQRRLSPSVGRGQRLYQRMIQTDAAINPGNSGGPLVNAEGNVVGVNTMIFSPNGGNVGLGFAIPIDRARRIAQEVIEHGRRRDPWPGFRVQELGSLPRPALERRGITTERGCLVINMMRNAPAYEAGLRPGDIIVRVNGEEVGTATDIDFVVWDSYVGDTLSVTYLRDGDERTIRFPVVELSR